ncbi:hypothetical protein AAFM46_15315 [Arthrobacter sp. TMP15]|uniref:hypothetical protein n=1 Tax=Arthrobacter sp. TMP15 TaxID=3140789 RepID=UPI0031B9F5D2
MTENLTKPTEFAGHNRISTQALTSLAKVAAAEVLAVAPAQVRVEFSDDAGSLALSISSAMGAPSLNDVRGNRDRITQSGGSILVRAKAAKASIMAEVERLSGSHVSRVNVRISGLVTRSDGRVL